MSPRTATAFAVPATLWATDNMLNAVAARDIAQVFRLIQRETGVSQTHLGVATGLSQAQVSEIICGSRRVTSVDVLSRIATGLRMSSHARVALLLGERDHAPTSSSRTIQEHIPSSVSGGGALSERFSDLTAIYPSRSEFTSRMPPHVLFDSARDIRAAGLSLNLICQQYADTQLAQLVRDEARIRLLFLDPAGTAIRAREVEEGQQAGQLSALTALNPCVSG